MASFARTIGFSMLAAVPGAVVAHILFSPYGETGFLSLVLGCTGGIIGAVAGAGYEIATALRQRTMSE